MLSGAVRTSSETAKRSGIVSRAAGRILAARTLEELRDQFASALDDLFGRNARFELFVCTGDADLEPVVHLDGSSARASRQLLAALRTRLFASRLALDEPQLLAAEATSERRPLMSVPLLGPRHDRLGVVVVEAASDEQDFTRTELVALEGIAAIASFALGELDRDGARVRREIDRKAARRLQRSFMSASLPPGIGVTAHAEYLPAFDVGGDFYSIKHLGDRIVSASIGDVSGNGVSAALLMSRVAFDVECAMSAGEKPSSVLASVNARLAGVESEMFVTASCIRLDGARRRLTIANAGHLPLVVRRANGEVFTFGGPSGAPLGTVRCDYVDDEIVLEAGDIILLMTDGLLEALDHPSGHRGMELLLDQVQAAPHDPEVLGARIRAEVEAARSEHVLDDVTWVALQLAC